MSDHAIDHGGHDAHDTAHPTAGVYLAVAAALTVLTVLEIAVYVFNFSPGVLVALLLILSAIKFYFVAAYYMHLKYDSLVYTLFFASPLVLAVLILFSLTFLLGGLSQRPGP
ncbi:MAG TPA: cytochrome C oxidase subunit IV family protein [Candidatus Binataceae bacterium]|nr:cytochrome C oxidase subunit IV family protein [Candidatus Binataceae bacterium]